MAEIGIFVGTVHGNALLVAEKSETILSSLDHKVTLYDNPLFSDWKKYESKCVLIITSSTGKGNLPDNIYPLFQNIRDQLNDQSNLDYGFIALGDSSYSNFCGGGKKFDSLLQRKGAKRIGNMLLIDAIKNPQPEDISNPWIRNWSKLL